MPRNSTNGSFSQKVKHAGHKMTLSGTLTNRKSTRFATFGVINTRKAMPNQQLPAEEFIEAEDGVMVADFDDVSEGESEPDFDDEDEVHLHVEHEPAWRVRQERRHDAWARLRIKITQHLAANMSGPIVEGHLCACGANATHRCWECSPSQLCGMFCATCSTAHSLCVFGHSPEIGDYVQKSTETHQQTTCRVRAYHMSGAYDMTLNVTEPAAAGLIEHGLFPSSPRSPTVVFSVDLLRYARFLVLSADLSMAKALEASAFFWKDPSLASDVLVQFRSALSEYMNCVHLLENPSSLARPDEGDLRNRHRSECPCCNFTGYERVSPVVRIADGYFSASHRIRGGRSYGTPAMDGVYFTLPNQSFVFNYQEVCKTRFRAATQESAKDKRFDITGIFGSVCRHGFIDDVFDMQKGEKYMYATTMLKNLRARFPQSKSVLFYDIGCHLAAHLAKSHPQLLPYISALPVLHSYCHGNECQAKYSPKNVYGLGHTDGEDAERFWSRLANFVGRTQSMTHEHRTDFLCHKFEFINRETSQHILPSLASSLELVVNLLHKTPKDPMPYHEVIHNVAPMTEETAEQLSYRQLCKLAMHIRAMEKHSGTNRIGTVMASKIKKMRSKNMAELGVMIDAHNEQYTKDVSMKQIFEGMDQIVVRKSTYWMALEELLFICDDVRSYSSALHFQKNKLLQIAEHFDEYQKGLAHFTRKKAVQAQKSEELAARLVASINQTLANEDIRIAVDQVAQAYQSQLHSTA